MKKILNISLILLFVSTLFISCLPHVSNPPINSDDSISSDCVADYQLDSVENYVFLEYLNNYQPNLIGDTFLFISYRDSVVDSIKLELSDNFYYKFSNLVDGSEPFNNIFEVMTDHIRRSFSYSNNEIIVNFMMLFSIEKLLNDNICEVDYSYYLYSDNDISAHAYCECTTKDCVSECCFPSFISIYKNDKLYVEVAHGKGITKFLDNNGVYWHLVE
ncbi:MAG: hypothetical protein ACI3ZZ_00120 [Candidatus Aphodosoma sp.]